MKSIYDLTLEQLKEELKALGQKPFRAKQIYEWIYVKNVYDFHQMTNLSKELQETLSNHFSYALLILLLIVQVLSHKLISSYILF